MQRVIVTPSRVVVGSNGLYFNEIVRRYLRKYEKIVAFGLMSGGEINIVWGNAEAAYRLIPQEFKVY